MSSSKNLNKKCNHIKYPNQYISTTSNIAEHETKKTDKVIFFDVYNDCESTNINNITEYLCDAIADGSRYTSKDLFKCMKKIVVSLYIAATNNDAWVAITRNKNHYCKNNRMRKIYMPYSKTMFIIKSLCAKKFIDYVNSYYSKQDNERSRMFLMKAETPIRSRFYAVPRSSIYKQNKHDAIELHGIDKKAKKYKDNRITERMRKEMNTINKLLESSDVKLALTDDELDNLNAARVIKDKSCIFTFSKYLSRIFNTRVGIRKGWILGGRLYGGFWQNIPKKFRPLLTIDGEDTVELDYKAFHPNLLYLEKTKKLYSHANGDPYVIEGFEGNEAMRKLMKIVLLILVNAKTEKSAMGAIKKECEDNYREDTEGLADLFQLYKKHKPKTLLAFAKKQHQDIAEYFCSDKGIHLQFKDSNLSVKILLRLAAEGILALPVHDSFIVQKKHEDRLRLAMEEEFFDMFGAIPPIDVGKGDIGKPK